MTRISLRTTALPAPSVDGLRPVNLREDLRPLADLIELVFADSMDSSGRSAIREMRALSHMGRALKLIARMNELALGISLGFVYVSDGKLVGNVSVYPAGYPKALGETWILANVAVRPDYQRRGIAHILVEASLDMIRQRGGARAILQVNCDNMAAQKLYERHGFIYERAWRIWRRSGFMRSPISGSSRHRISHLHGSEWAAELALAEAARPNSRGGVGWQKPLHRSTFYTPLRKRLLNMISLSGLERLVIRDEASREILASCWLESGLSFSSIRGWLFASPRVESKPYAQALIDYVVSRHERATIQIEHPRDDEVANQLMRDHQFKVMRELWHMRLDL
ncbi:MAG: GNAT family N-acetyltransferase [Chloroflexi bacterium]|nr:GNAT family N-acetyltransferase [Chloroflexota bacterium]